MASHVLGLGDVAPYLMRHGLLTAGDVVEGGLAIVDVSRRNLDYRVTARGAGYLVKQGVDAEKRRMIGHEAAVYDLLWSIEGARPPARFLPRKRLHDAGAAVLVLELIRGSRTLDEHVRARGRLPRAIAAELGRLLAEVHALCGPERAAALATAPPFGLSLHRPDLRVYESASRAAIELLRIVHQADALCTALDEVRDGWRVDALVHGDLRWDNCHAVARAGGGGRELRLVDWELAGAGDRAWDVATVLGEFLATWLQSTPIGGQVPPEQLLRFSRRPLESMWPAIGSFWRAYVRAGGAAGEPPGALLERATRYTATRLVQTAFEWVQVATQVSDHAVFLLQLAANILRAPAEASERLLGIRAELAVA